MPKINRYKPSEEEYKIVEQMAMAGWDYERIAEALRLKKSELMGMVAKDVKLDTVIRSGRDFSIGRAVESLYKKAMGYDYEELHYKKDGNDMVLEKKVVKHMPPDTFALNSYLNNRDPANWKIKREEDAKPKVRINVKMSGKQLLQLQKQKRIENIEEALVIEG